MSVTNDVFPKIPNKRQFGVQRTYASATDTCFRVYVALLFVASWIEPPGMSRGRGRNASSSSDYTFEPFSMNNEYEGASWVDGEFYYRTYLGFYFYLYVVLNFQRLGQEKQRAKPSKESNIYGVFGDESDDSVSSSSSSSRGGNRRAAEYACLRSFKLLFLTVLLLLLLWLLGLLLLCFFSFRRPVQFVSRGHQVGSEEPAAARSRGANTKTNDNVYSDIDKDILDEVNGEINDELVDDDNNPITDDDDNNNVGSSSSSAVTTSSVAAPTMEQVERNDARAERSRLQQERMARWSKLSKSAAFATPSSSSSSSTTSSSPSSSDTTARALNEVAVQGGILHTVDEDFSSRPSTTTTTTAMNTTTTTKPTLFGGVGVGVGVEHDVADSNSNNTSDLSSTYSSSERVCTILFYYYCYWLFGRFFNPYLCPLFCLATFPPLVFFVVRSTTPNQVLDVERHR